MIDPMRSAPRWARLGGKINTNEKRIDGRRRVAKMNNPKQMKEEKEKVKEEKETATAEIPAT